MARPSWDVVAGGVKCDCCDKTTYNKIVLYKDCVDERLCYICSGCVQAWYERLGLNRGDIGGA